MKVLVVDDSAFVRNVLETAISTAYPDAVMILCGDGREALDAFSSFKPDWVITDLLMPVMTGQELLDNLIEFAHPFKTIVITADVQNSTKEQLEAYGIESIINKPMTEEKLTQMIALLKVSDNDE